MKSAALLSFLAIAPGTLAVSGKIMEQKCNNKFNAAVHDEMQDPFFLNYYKIDPMNPAIVIRGKKKDTCLKIYTEDCQDEKLMRDLAEVAWDSSISNQCSRLFVLSDGGCLVRLSYSTGQSCRNAPNEIKKIFKQYGLVYNVVKYY